MIPVLYDGSETNFNHNGLGFLVDVDSKSIYVERERNGNQLLVMKYPENGAKVEGLVKGNIIKVDASPKRKGQLFRIYYIKKDIKDLIVVYAKHILFDSKHDTLTEYINETLTCKEALNKLKMNSVFSLKKFTMESDLVTPLPFVQDESSILDCIIGSENSVLSIYGNDPDLVVDNFKLKVTQQGGVDSSVLIAYTKNMDGYTMEEDCDTLITGIIPYVSYNDSGEEVYIKGDLVWSDKKNNYAHPYVTHMNFTDNFTDRATNTFRKPSVAELDKAAKDYILSSRCDIPKMTYTISFVPLSKTEEYKHIAAIEELDLLDKVIIHNHKYGVRDQAKIIKTKYNPVKETFISMTLGDPRSTLQSIFNTSGSKLDSVANKIDNVITGGIPPKFPDTLPTVPVLKVDTSGLKTIALSWTFDNKLHYTYRLYANRQKDFTPTIFDLVFEGQASTYLHEVDYNQIWYYRVEAINTYGRSTGPSNQVMGATVKLSDAATIFEEAAIGDALIANLRADRAWIGKFKADTIDFRNATCTDGNDQTTFSIDSFGRVRIIATEFMLQGKTIENIVQEETATTVKSVNPMFYLSTSETELVGGKWMDVAPPWTNGKYMWTKTVTTLGDGSTRETQPTCISGAIGPQGKPGIDGSDGVNGKDGISLVYKGEFTSHPSNPQDGWYYRNTAQGKTFVYQSGAWYQMTIDGQDGADGASIEYKGELDNPPANPQKNWTYRDKQNGILYIYNGSAWAVMVRDGNDGTPGTPGNNGLSVFCTYHDGENKPTTPTGDGTTGGWHTNWTANVIWLSQKVSSSVTSGSWGAPIKIAGEDGVSVLSVTEQFFLSNSKDHQPEENASGWVDVCPPWEPGKYIWTRVKVTLSNNTVKYTGYNVDTTWEVVTELQISDRNLVLNSDKFITTGSDTSTCGIAKDFIAKFNENLGKRMYLSLEINANNAISTAASGFKRIGCEIALIFEDETASYIGAWQPLINTPLNCTNLRISRAYDIPHKRLKGVTYCGLYIQGLTSGSVKVGRPKLQISDKVTDWSPAPEDVKKDIADVSGALNKLDTSVKDAFGDGIINDSEAKALASNIQILDNEKADIDRQYTTLINNHLLTGTVKTNLTNSKTAYDSAHASLKSGINTAISDKRITDSERNSVNSFFSTYRSKLADFKQRAQEALDAVGQQRVEGIEIGGRNLLKKSGELVTNNSYLVKNYKVSELLKEGDTYTVSLCVTPADKVSNFGVYFSQGYSQVANLITQGNTKQVLTKTFKMKYDPDRVPTNIDSINAECRVHRFPNNGTVVGNSTIHWIQIEKGTKATDWSPAPEDVIANIKDVSDALGGLDSAVKKAFGDNIVNSSEAMAIQSNIQILDNEKADIDKEYTIIYGNTKLTGTPKTNLYNAKNEYNTAHASLKSTINSATADRQITDSERNSVNNAFATYRTKLANYKQRVQEALDAIGNKRVDDIQLGVRNILKNGNINFTSSNYIMITKYTSVKLVKGRKYTIVMKAKTTGGQRIRVSMNNGADVMGSMPVNQNGVAYFTFTAVTPTSVDYENAIKFHNYPESGASYNSATINWVCVYEGEIKPPLDWTPTPEEIQSAIDRKVENNQLAIFNSLTNNGQTQGIYLSNSKIYINGEYIKANSINVDRLKAGIFKGNAFFTAADSGSTDGYAFRIYADGRVYSKKAIQVYGTKEDGDYSQISATRINTTGYVQCSGYKTDNATLYLAVDGADVNNPTGDNGRRIKLYRNTTEGATYFMPDYDGAIRLGTTNKKWKVVYAKDGVSTTSDRRLKENIRYIDGDPSTITPQMMLEFIMQDYILAQYNYIDDPLEERISAIAQDLLIKESGEESKVGQLIINNQEALYNKRDNGPGYLSMNQTQLLNVFIGAFQQFVRDVNREFEQLKS